MEKAPGRGDGEVWWHERSRFIDSGLPGNFVPLEMIKRTNTFAENWKSLKFEGKAGATGLRGIRRKRNYEAIRKRGAAERRGAEGMKVKSGGRRVYYELKKRISSLVYVCVAVCVCVHV